MYVRSLKIEDLRCFERAEVEFQYPGRGRDAPPLSNVNLLLGDNGAGKTTVLKAIVLGVLERILSGSGYVPYNLVRRRLVRRLVRRSLVNGRFTGPKSVPLDAQIRLKLLLHAMDLEGRSSDLDVSSKVRIARVRDREWLTIGHDREEMSQDPTWGALFEDDSPAFLLVGYGSTRFVVGSSELEPRASQSKRRTFRYQRVAGLFEDFIGLAPLGSWLPQVAREDAARFEEIGDLLNELLPASAKFVGETEGDEYLFEHCGLRVPLGALSDGYRAYIGWVSDLLYNIHRGAVEGTRLRDVRGVVLVDEIDLHLHPEWQREVVPTVARTLPNLQFVFTTHSPIVAGTLSPKNIFVLDMDGAGASTIRQFTEPIHALNADQILVSSYFGLSTTRAPAAEDQLRELSKKALAGDSSAAVAFLKKLASGTDEPASPPKKAKKSPRKATPSNSRRTRAR